ncbi:unnamed protein product, partial [Discosporangium mesarthrocarpum]
MSVQKRALSGLLRQARETFTNETQGTSLVAPISPTPLALVEMVLETLSLTSDDTLVDLGCGDGRWLETAAAKAGCRGLGFDLNKQLLERGRSSIERAGFSSLVNLEERDIFDVPLGVATVIIVFLYRKGLSRLKTKLQEEVSPGARVVSVGFHIPGWTPSSEVASHGLHTYIY